MNTVARIIGKMTVAVIMAAMFAMAHGAQAGATLSKVNVKGNLVPGGTVQYTAVINSDESGMLKLVGKVSSSTGFTAEFDVIEQSISSGKTKLTSNTVAIPSTFAGPARVVVTATFKGVKIGRVNKQFTVVGPISVTEYDAGFDAEVELDGRLLNTDGMTAPIAFAWTQTDTDDEKQLDINNANAAVASITTLPLEHFINLEVDELEPFGVVGIDTHQVEMSTYHLRLVASDGSISRTGTWTVVSASMSPGHKVVPVGVSAHLKTAEVEEVSETAAADTAYNWTITSQPPGSSAALLQANTRTPSLRPDVEGNYTISDAVLGTNITLVAATYTGVDFCNICHGPDNNVGLRDIVTPWSGTGHASFLQKGLDGELGAYYNENCIKCHTVGYDKTPTANNSGFDDVAASIGWKFPATKAPGTYDAQPAAIKALAGIQCESCHGPGSRHPGSDGVTLNTAMCATCHQDGHYHTRVEQWEQSPHARPYEIVSEEEGSNGTCARCHAPMGFVDVSKRIAYDGLDMVTASKTNNYARGTGKLACQTCHDPHHSFDNDDRHQLRIYDEVVLGNPGAAGYVLLQDQGASASCMYCHNTRRLPFQLSGGNPQYTAQRSGNLAGPHESTAAEIFSGLGGVEYGVAMGNTFHTYGANCVMCHMYPNPGATDPGHNKVGDHTFAMKYMDGETEVENLATCNQCHAGAFEVDKFDFKSLAAKDWDGSGDVAGVQTETQGLLDRVRVLMETSGMIANTNEAGLYTGFKTNGLSADPVIKDAQQKAAWNWMMINRDGSKGVHNPLYTIRLLQNTYTDLSTNYYGDVNRTFINEYPDASLR